MKRTLKDFAKNFIAKSYDFPDSQIIIDAKDQQAAEEGTPKGFLSRLASQITQGKTVHKIPLQKGYLTLANKDANLYTGFFCDEQGQIIEKFDAHTLEMIAKTLIVKKHATDHDVYAADEDLEDRASIMPVVNSPSITIKMGDIEIQLRKSIKQFVDDFKKARNYKEENIRKAIKSWRRSQKFQHFSSDTEAAQAILDDWDQQKESFSQTLFAIEQMRK